MRVTRTAPAPLARARLFRGTWEALLSALLPSGPDAVRRLPMRGTWLSTLRAPAQAPDDSAPRAVLGPAIADCGFREPLAPRLARPGREIVAHCEYPEPVPTPGA